MKNKKKYIINACILFIVMGFTLFYLLKDNGVSKLASLSNLSFFYIALLIGFIIFIFLIEGLIIKIASMGVSSTFSYKDALLAYTCGNFGSNISPFKILHYPSLFYLYNKRGVTFEEGLANTTKCSIVYGSATTALYTILFIICHINKFTITINSHVVYIEIATIIGLLVNVFQIVFYLVLAYNEKLHDKFIKLMGAILYKFKRITNKEEYCDNQKLKMIIFKKEISYFLKHLSHFVYMFALYIIRVLLFGSMVYFVYLMLSHQEFKAKDMVMFFILYQAATYLANIVPTPGGSGGFEFTFSLAYVSVISETYLTSVMLIYRSITYFIPLLIEAVIFIFIVLKNKKVVALKSISEEESQNRQLENNS